MSVCNMSMVSAWGKIAYSGMIKNRIGMKCTPSNEASAKGTLKMSCPLSVVHRDCIYTEVVGI